MLVQVKRGYISKGRQLFGKGDTVELNDTVAARFLKSGQVVAAEQTTKAPTKVPTKGTTKKSESKTAHAETASLPNVDPAAVVVRAKKK